MGGIMQKLCTKFFAEIIKMKLQFDIGESLVEKVLPIKEASWS